MMMVMRPIAIELTFFNLIHAKRIDSLKKGKQTGYPLKNEIFSEMACRINNEAT